MAFGADEYPLVAQWKKNICEYSNEEKCRYARLCGIRNLCSRAKRLLCGFLMGVDVNSYFLYKNAKCFVGPLYS